jgi:membrane dipeptidase
LKLTRAPVVASHSGAKGVIDAPRNLSDAELDAIKANGGVVQVVAFGPYLVKPRPGLRRQGRADPRPVRPARRLRQAGDGTETLPPERADYSHADQRLLPKATVKDLATRSTTRSSGSASTMWASSDFNHGGGVVGWANEGEAANVTAELLRRGYSEADIDKLWGGNYLRVFKAVEAKARR